VQPTVGKRAFVPMRLLDRETVKKAQASLRYVEKITSRIDTILADQEYDEDQEDAQSDGPRIVTVNEFVRCRGGVSLPRAWAMKNLDLPWVDNTTPEQHTIRLGKGPKPRDDRQREFFAKILAEATQPGPQDILANANTGAGKSVAGIWLGHTLGYRTLIVVDSNKIANGWLKNFQKFYGEEWTRQNVGRIQQDLCEFEDKAFSIALVQSIAARGRRYPAEFYSAFGLVVFDEVQIFGSATYAPVLAAFNARVRIGFTAENRSGAFGRLIQAHLGKPRVISKQQVLQPRAYLIKNKIDQTFYCMSDGAILTGLSRIHDRNEKLAKLITRRGYERGRNVLILSDRTEQLVWLRNMCAELGVPTEAMGLHMGTYISGRHEVVYSYGKNNQLLAVFDTLNEARAVVRLLKRGLPSVELPKALAARLRKDPKSVIFSTRKEEYSPDQKELDNITNSCQLVFATYQIFSKGVDVPRLDMGVEGLPSGNLKQPLGRILRLYDGKPEPEWYAICDTVELPELFGNATDPAAGLINAFLSGKTKTRINALKRANAKLTYA
jgi:superfamily II DNA or RNA helicase